MHNWNQFNHWHLVNTPTIVAFPSHVHCNFRNVINKPRLQFTAKYSSIALINHVNGTDGGAPTVGNYRTKVWVVNTDDREEDFPCELVVFIDKKDHVHVYFTGLGDAATATGMRTHSGYFICIKAREAAEPPSFNLMWMRDPFYAQAEAADVSINALFDSNSNKIRFDRDPRLVEHLLRGEIAILCLKGVPCDLQWVMKPFGKQLMPKTPAKAVNKACAVAGIKRELDDPWIKLEPIGELGSGHFNISASVENPDDKTKKSITPDPEEPLTRRSTRGAAVQQPQHKKARH